MTLLNPPYPSRTLYILVKMPFSTEPEKTLTPEQKAAFQKLQDAAEKLPVHKTRAAVEMAKLHPDIVLVEKMWRVKCVVWDGREIDAWTSEKSIGGACRDAFGWEVTEEEDDWWYKYTMSLEDTHETRNFFEWICPPDPIPASKVYFPDQPTGQHPLLQRARDEWKRCNVQTVRE